MHHQSPALAFVVIIAICCFAAGAHAQTTRSTQRHDLDHPWDFKPAFRDKGEWAARAKALRTQTLVATGLWPMPEKTPLKAVVHGKIDRDDYTVEKVSFVSMPGHYVTGNLYRPKNRTGKLPAILSPHGHWPGGRFMWRNDADAQKEVDLGAEGSINAARSPMQSRCAMLARMGCVVFHYDMLGYGDSTAIKHREGFDDVEATLRLQSQLGLQTWNGIRGLDFLCELPDVDTTRLAVTGASGGGTQTFLICATDDRPTVSFPAVMVSMAMQGGCVCENAPLLRVGTNNVELACLFAPKPLGMTGANDWTKDVERRGLPEAKAIYKLYGAEDRVAAKHFPFEHNFNQVSREYMYEWMNRHLKLGLTSPIKERPFDPIPPEQLSVYDDVHPRPADEKDAAALRKSMIVASDARLIVKPDPEILREALAAMLVYGGNDAERAFETISAQNPSGRAVVWVSAQRPTENDIAKLLDRRVTVYWPTSSHAATQPTTRYAGFTLGYNRSPIAQHAVDILGAIEAASRDSKSVELIAVGRAGPAGALARALAGDRVKRAVIDLDHFDFDGITDPSDDRVLPGALKYGGMRAFVSIDDTATEYLNDVNADAIVDRLLK